MRHLDGKKAKNNGGHTEVMRHLPHYAVVNHAIHNKSNIQSAEVEKKTFHWEETMRHMTQPVAVNHVTRKK